jgi:hypothetical protein
LKIGGRSEAAFMSVFFTKTNYHLFFKKIFTNKSKTYGENWHPAQNLQRETLREPEVSDMQQFS